MIPLIAYLIVVVHFVADFPLQDSSWGAEKWHNMDVLINHIAVYTLSWFIFFLLIYQPSTYSFAGNVVFCFITYITHFATDFISSKVTHYYWMKQKFGSAIPNWGFFSVLGLDQLIHVVTLFLTYNFVFGPI